MKRLFFIFLTIVFSIFSLTSVFAFSAEVSVPEKYTDVVAGERFYFGTEIKYPENPSRKDLRLNYEISKDGNIIAQSQVLKAIETQSSFIDFIVIPKTTKTGLHIIKIKISDYEDLSEEVSASFHVISEQPLQMTIYFFILLGATIIVGILVVINLFLTKKIKYK